MECTGRRVVVMSCMQDHDEANERKILSGKNEFTLIEHFISKHASLFTSLTIELLCQPVTTISLDVIIISIPDYIILPP